MRFLLLLPLLSLPILAHAEACPAIEYTELRDMKREELQAKYCEFTNYYLSKQQEARRLAQNGEMVSLQYQKYAFKCKTEAKRVADTFERKFSVAVSDCNPSERPIDTKEK